MVHVAGIIRWHLDNVVTYLTRHITNAVSASRSPSSFTAVVSLSISIYEKILMKHQSAAESRK
jgi:hypothetical protein